MQDTGVNRLSLRGSEMIMNYFTPLSALKPITDEDRVTEVGVTKGTGRGHGGHSHRRSAADVEVVACHGAGRCTV